MFVKAEMDYWCFRDPLSGASTSSIKGVAVYGETWEELT